MTSRRSPKPVKGFAATRNLRGITRRAANDVEQGRQDTDLRRSNRMQPKSPGKGH
jgi:hypothetical protein